MSRIYVVRALVGKFFDYRISTNAQHVEDLEKQREETIDKLKAATKYNSTQQLLEKYGGESPKPSPRSNENPRKPNAKSNPSTPQQQQQQPVPRTGLMPPPTANINRGLSPASPGAATPPASSSSPQNLPPPPYGMPRSPFPPSHPQPQPQPNDEPGFAPNAFPSSQYIEQPHWYDRLLDVLLGDDETQPKNRIALLCTTCRLVNGQAAPGIKTPEELGRWRCASCGAWNGHESEASQVLANIRGQSPSPSPSQSQSQSQHQSASANETWDPVSRADVDTPSSGNPKDEAVFVAASDDARVGSGSPEEEEEDQPSRKKDSRPAKGGKAGKRRG